MSTQLTSACQDTKLQGQALFCSLSSVTSLGLLGWAESAHLHQPAMGWFNHLGDV